MSNKVVVVTGFGPFRGHEEVNPSWEAVRVLPNELEFNGIVYPIRKFEIPVLYEQVEQAEKDIWALDPLVSEWVGNGSSCLIYLPSFFTASHPLRCEWADKLHQSGEQRPKW